MSKLDKFNLPRNYLSYVEYYILSGKPEKTLESLQNPETAKDAAKVVIQKITKKNYSQYIPLNNLNIIYKIIKEAFENNKTIDEQLTVFIQKNQHKTAKAKLELLVLTGNYANNTYQPTHKIA